MPKTSLIKLGGTDYTVPQLNIDQLERVVDLFGGPAARVGFGVVRIALERGEPKVEDFAQIEADMDEIAAAAKAVLILSGLQPKEPTAGEVKPAA